MPENGAYTGALKLIAATTDADAETLHGVAMAALKCEHFEHTPHAVVLVKILDADADAARDLAKEALR